MSMYTGAKTVATVYGNSKCSGVHQGSALSPLVFVIDMEAIITRIQSCLTTGDVVG